MGCYIWYSEEGTGRGRSLPRPLFAYQMWQPAHQRPFYRAVAKAPKSSHITPILKSLHCLKVNERIKYKLLSLTYKVLTTTQPIYLNNLISVQPLRSTRSSSVVTLSRPPTISLKITDRSFRCITPSLESTPWFFSSASPVISRLTSFTCQLISVIITTLIIHHSFTLSLKSQNHTFSTNPSHLNTSSTLDCFHDHGTGPDLSCFSIYF